MISASSALLTFLDNLPSTFFYEDLYTITLVNGTVIRLTSGGQDIKYGGNTFTSYSPQYNINRARVKTSIGLTVDEVEVSIIADPSAQPVSGVPFVAEFVNGYFDNATVLIQRLYMPTYGDTSLGAFNHFSGFIAEITEMTKTEVHFTVQSKLALLNQPLPRQLYTPACRHALYDAGCLLTRSSFGVAGTVISGSNKSQIIANLSQRASSPAPGSAPSLGLATPDGTNLSSRIQFVVITYVYATGESTQSPESHISLSGKQVITVASPSSATGVLGWNCYVGLSPGNEMLQNATPIPIGTGFQADNTDIVQGSPPPDTDTSGYFALGVIEFTSGPNAGLTRGVTTYIDGPSTNKTINIVPPLPLSPTAGDNFTIYPGCDKRLSTCVAKFNNIVHFGGFPWIPEPTTAV